VSNILRLILFLKAFQKLLGTSLKPSDMEIMRHLTNVLSISKSF